MRRVLGLVTGCALLASALVLTSSPVRAQNPPMVTLTFRLTINGTAPSQYSFGVEHQVELCAAPCVGGGHTYTKTIPWLKTASPVQFVFSRFIVGSGTQQANQEFARQTVIPSSNRAVTAVYTFQPGANPVATPSAGGVEAGTGSALALAQTMQSLVTFTMKLTINGTPPKGDSFSVAWGESGLGLCARACLGGGHTYTQTMTFPVGVTETFVFLRSSGPVSPTHPAQRFARQTLTANRGRTISAVFTYGTPAVSTPATGATPALVLGSTVAAASVALLLASARRRRQSP